MRSAGECRRSELSKSAAAWPFFQSSVCGLSDQTTGVWSFPVSTNRSNSATGKVDSGDFPIACPQFTMIRGIPVGGNGLCFANLVSG